jgi:hypothetical protein
MSKDQRICIFRRQSKTFVYLKLSLVVLSAFYYMYTTVFTVLFFTILSEGTLGLLGFLNFPGRKLQMHKIFTNESVK